eukprot:2471459-Lingulodinium_polyedra.AAC.1
MVSSTPVAVASSWADIPGAVVLATQFVHKEDGAPANWPRALAIINVNVPIARDSFKLSHAGAV